MNKISKYQSTLYHRILRKEHLDLFLKDDVLYMNPKLGCVCFTRNKFYLDNRKYGLILDRDLLKQNYKIMPYHYQTTIEKKFGKRIDESEERIYRDIKNLHKYIVKIIELDAVSL